MPIIFQPWIGANYRKTNRFGVRVLVLGESHYGDISDTRSTLTTEVVRWLAQDKRDSFFTKISKVLLGLDKNTWLDDEKRGEVWEHVAFYNFIQEFVGIEPRVRPTNQMWENGKEPFLEIIKELNTEVILVLGKELSTAIPNIPEGIEIGVIQHPSTGFSYEKWNPVFIEAVKRANG